MKLTLREVQKAAKLSRLILSDEEQENMVKDLNDFLNYADLLSKLDLDDVEPISHVIPVHNAFREDEIKPSMVREQLMDNAPEKEKGTFKVPKVIE